MGDWYTWSEFKAAVLALMPLDKNRQGFVDTTTDDGVIVPGYNSLMIRHAVIDLQTFIPQYRKQHETLYYPCDMVTEGSASRGALPPFAEVQDAYLFSFDNDTRYPLLGFPWEQRHELTNGLTTLSDNNGKLCIEPDAYKFYIYPALAGNWVLSLNWNALLDTGKSDFADAELVPFPEGAVLAVSEFLKGRIEREVNKDMSAFASYFHPVTGTYTVARKNLFLTAQERTRSQR